MKKIMVAAAAALLSLGTAASAATLSVIGGNAVAFNTGNYDDDCTDGRTHCYDPSGPAGALTEDLTTFFSGDAYPGLAVSGAARIRVTFLGKEAGALNKSLSVAGGVLSNEGPIGASYDFTQAAGGTLDFTFRSPKVGGLGTQAGSQGFIGSAGIAFSQLYDGGRTVYAFFDDSGANKDRDWDDMVVKISILPVPAAGLMLLGGLGGLAALRRRKKA